MWLDWSSIWPTGGISVSISDRCYGDLLFCHPVIPLHQLSSCCHFHHVQEHIIFRLEPFSPCEELRRTQWSLYVDASYLCHVYFTGVAAGQRLTGFKLNCMVKPQNIYLVMSQPASDTEKWIKSSVLTFRSQHKWEERCPVSPTGASKERFCLHLLRCEEPLCDVNVVDMFQSDRIKVSVFTSRRAGFGAENEASEAVFRVPRALLFTCPESKWACLCWIATHPNPLSNNVRCGGKLICFQFWCFLAIVNTLRLNCNRPRAFKPSPVWMNTKEKKCFHYSFSLSFLFSAIVCFLCASITITQNPKTPIYYH